MPDEKRPHDDPRLEDLAASDAAASPKDVAAADAAQVRGGATTSNFNVMKRQDKSSP